MLAALARAQAAEGIVPAEAAEHITRAARVELLDLELVAEQTRLTGHSTLGLIRALGQVLPPDVHEHVYVGATVQDLTDTWTSLALRSVGGEVWRDLRRVEELLLDLAERHRDTVVAGRTHGQPGAPVTFGWKAAGWADEVRRHLDRLREGAPRWLVGQLGGGVGTLAALGPAGLDVRRRFCRELGLHDPGISWLAARDRVAEVGAVLAMVTGTLARIGGEVYELQRPEIGELREPARPDVVGSITMPHKRNPERSEHLDTLARLVRAGSGVLMEGMVAAHERDGRGWKAEWVALPEVCLLTAAARAGRGGAAGGARGRRRGDASPTSSGTRAARPRSHSSPPGSAGTPRAAPCRTPCRSRGPTASRWRSPSGRPGLLTDEEISLLVPDTGAAGAMVDLVVSASRAARAEEGGTWP